LGGGYIDTNVIYNEECIKGMKKRIPDNSIDMILADLPYGTTACKWDSIIPLEPLWKQYKRVIKENGAIVLTASQPFTTKLINSNMKWFRYEVIWEKERPSNPLMANKQIMKYHENILIFYKKLPTFNPQLRKRNPSNKRNNSPRKFNSRVLGKGQPNYKYMNQSGMKDYIKPKSVLKFTMDRGLHPTQKPVALFEYLIKTYTNKNEIVLDNAIGSGTTAIACLKTNRNFIGFEKEKEYYHIALKRVGKFNKEYYKELPKEVRPKQKQLF
jgi:site-specific DNA-methyltransferase (adenine-specific)